MKETVKQTLLVILGAGLGGYLGFLGFGWALKQGFYAMVLPGGALGLGAGVARNRSITLAILCGLCALALGVFTEWKWFRVDDSLTYMFLHLQELKPMTLVMILLGGWIGFWVPFRRIPATKQQSTTPAA